MTYDERNRTTKSRQIKTVLRKGNLQILGNIWGGENQPSGDESKIKYLSRTRKLLETKSYGRNNIREEKNVGCFPSKILENIFEVGKGRTQTRKQEK